jgi:serine/threonine protein kinase
VRHQDIKPENVFLANIDPDADSQSSRVLPVLLDLGVAAKDAELVLAGTPAYFAPEVAARFASVPDPPPVGPKADVFSLALTLQHALDPTAITFSGRDAVDAFVSFRANHAPSPPEHRDLRDLRLHFERWLHLSPDVRPSADEFRRELAVLTRPEERRARRLGVMRWVLPLAVAVLALFGAVVYSLSREASLQRIEALEERLRADRARERAESIHANLEEEEARRKQLEVDIGHLEEQYQNSRLTREQLAARLATMEGEFSLLSEQQTQQQRKLYKQKEELKTLREQVMFLGSDLASARRRKEELSFELDRLRPALENERARRNDIEAQLESSTQRLQASEMVASDARGRLIEMTRRFELLQEALNPQHLGVSPKASSATSSAVQPRAASGESASTQTH